MLAVAGRLTRAHRIDEAIWNFELVRTLNERARLLVLGDGPDRSRLERFARLVSMPQAVKFLGDSQDATEVLPGIDVFWYMVADTSACATAGSTASI